jgi:hypothetical protein
MPSGPHAFDVSKPFKHSEISFTLMVTSDNQLIQSQIQFNKYIRGISYYTYILHNNSFKKFDNIFEVKIPSPKSRTNIHQTVQC